MIVWIRVDCSGISHALSMSSPVCLRSQGHSSHLHTHTFLGLTRLSLLPALLACLCVSFGVHETPNIAPTYSSISTSARLTSSRTSFSLLSHWARLPRRYWEFVGLTTLFQVALFNDALIILRANQVPSSTRLIGNRDGDERELFVRVYIHSTFSSPAIPTFVWFAGGFKYQRNLAYGARIEYRLRQHCRCCR